MSTKTTLKRVALAAVSALGFGLLSVVPTNAALSGTQPIFEPSVPTVGNWTANATNTVYNGTQVASTGGYFEILGKNDFTGSGTVSYTLSVTGSTVQSSRSAFLSSFYDATGADGVTGTGSLAASTWATGGIVTAAGINATARALYATSFGCKSGDAMLPGGELDDLVWPTTGNTVNVYKFTANLGAGFDCGTLYVADVNTAVVAPTITNAANGTAGNARFRVNTTTAGSITATLIGSELSGGVAVPTTLQTFNVLVIGAGAYQTTTVGMAADGANDVLSAEASPVVYSSQAAGQAAADLTITHVCSVTCTANLLPAYTVSLSGVGYLSDGVSTGGYLAYAAGTTPSVVTVYSDGRGGAATVTVAVNGNTVSTKTVKFYGKAATVTATPIYSIAAAGGAQLGDVDGASATGDIFTPDITNDVAIAVLVTDALGTPIPTLAALNVVSDLSMTSSNPLVINSGMTEWRHDSGSGIYSAGALYQHVSITSNSNAKSGNSADLTFRVTNQSDATVISSNPVKMTIGGEVAKVTLAVDKESYMPGEKGSITVTATDSSGNPVWDGATLFAPAALGAISTTTSFGSLGLTATTSTVGGKATRSFFAPVVPGTFQIKALLADAVTSVTANVVVKADTSAIDAAVDAANEAIDAANAATDAANLAAEAADAATVAAEEARDAADAATAAVEELATQVAALMAALKAQITTLANTVAKIAKKIKA